MRGLVLVAVVAIMLSGCSNSSGLTTYIMQPGDATGCSLMPMSDDDLKEAKEEAGLTGNPGSLRNDIFEIGGVAPIDNLVSIYECDDDQEQAFSQALQFSNVTQADKWLNQAGYCQYEDNAEGLLQDGAVVAMAMGPTEVESAWHTRLANQTAAGPAC